MIIQPGAGITKKLVRGNKYRRKGEDDEAIQYFDFILPRLKEAEGPNGSGKVKHFYEGIQYPGETMFVPSNWWHAVLNLDNTIAITENFCSDSNFEKVWI